MIDIQSLINSLKIGAPIGVEVPRDPRTNEVDTVTMTRWALDAAGEINARSGRTTRLETTITTAAGIQEYSLPAGCREVIKIDRSSIGDGMALGVPLQVGGFGLGIAGGLCGTLPSGQEISLSLDVIHRQRKMQGIREDEWELIGTRIRFLFPIGGVEQIKVTYYAIDRTLDAIADDRYELVLTFMKFKNLEFYLGKHGVGIVQNGDRFGVDALAAIQRQKMELQGAWLSGLNGIGREVA